MDTSSKTHLYSIIRRSSIKSAVIVHFIYFFEFYFSRLAIVIFLVIDILHDKVLCT
jgi:hypothetical protein